MKKKYIYKEFEGLGKMFGGGNRKAAKMYQFRLCELLGGIDYKKPFAMYCSRKRSEIFQPTKDTISNQIATLTKLCKETTGMFFYFGKDQESSVVVDGNAILNAYRNYQ